MVQDACSHIHPTHLSVREHHLAHRTNKHHEQKLGAERDPCSCKWQSGDHNRWWIDRWRWWRFSSSGRPCGWWDWLSPSLRCQSSGAQGRLAQVCWETWHACSWLHFVHVHKRERGHKDVLRLRVGRSVLWCIVFQAWRAPWPTEMAVTACSTII